MNPAVGVPNRGPGKAAWIVLILTWALFSAFPIFGGFVGWPLNLVVFILSIVVMSKGNTISGIFLLLCSVIVSPLVYWVIGPAIFVAALGGGDMLKGWVEVFSQS